MSSKFLLYRERFWLIVSTIASIVLLVSIFQDGFHQLNQIALIFIMVAWAIFFVSRGMRKRIARFEAEQKNSKKKPTKKEVK
jgi:hypothetical protein